MEEVFMKCEGANSNYQMRFPCVELVEGALEALN